MRSNKPAKTMCNDVRCVLPWVRRSCERPAIACACLQDFRLEYWRSVAVSSCGPIWNRLDVRFGSKADIGLASNDVRFTPPPKRTFGAASWMSALCQKRTHAAQQILPYSITLSAVESSVGGTVIPSILAVRALMTSSNFVACTTGKSAGFAPLMIRPA
jgi:hypothetical protein